MTLLDRARPLILTLAAGLVALALVGCGEGERTGPDEGIERPAPAEFRGGRLPGSLDRSPAPQFRLADGRGGTLDTREFAGRPYVVTFLYTSCRDVCLAIGQEVGRALKTLNDEGRDVAAVAVSVDPEGDTPGAVRRWLREQDVPENFHYLIGSRRELRPVWKAYFAAPQPEHTSESRHTASIWLIDRRGRLRTKFSGGIVVPPSDIAHDLRLLAEEEG